jgi:uncharacterized OsmC-like protein
MSNQTAARETVVEGQSTGTFGRVLCSARTHHFVADGPVSSGCPGEALGPGELFLSGVASCGVELVQVLARDAHVPLTRVSTTFRGSMAGARDASRDVALFNSVRLHFTLKGVTQEQGNQLIDGFKRR